MAQPISTPEFTFGNALQHYTDENGLPQNSVTQLAFDNAGYLWFSTSAGVVRFDGIHFVVLDKKMLGLGDPIIEHFVVDKISKSLYVIGRSHKVGVIYDGKYRVMNRQVPDKPYHPGSPLLSHLPGRAVPYAFNGIHYSYIIPTGKGSYYTLCADTLTMYANNQKTVTRLPNNQAEPWRFFVVGEKLYHLDARGSIKEYGKSIKNITLGGDLPKNKNYGKSGNEIRALLNPATGEVFIYLENALYLMEENESGKLSSRLILTGFDFSDHAVSTICYDKHNGRLFIGSYTDGLFVFTRKQFATLSMDEMAETGAGNSYSALVSLTQNKVLTSGGNVFGNNGALDYLEDFSTMSDRVSVAKDFEGNIWSKKISMLYKWDKNAQSLLQSWPVNRIVSVIYSGVDSCIWIGTKTPGGLYVLDFRKKDAQPERLVGSIPDVTSIAQNKRGILWLGTVSGLYELDGYSGKLNMVEQLKGRSIRSVYADEKNPENIWATVEDEGIYLHRQKETYRMPLDKEKFLTDARCMLRDSLGYFWITSGKGLFRVYEQDFIDYADKKNDRVYYYYYGKSSGFNTNEFSGFCEPCGVMLENGYFSFPSLNGLVWFNPAEVSAEYPDKGIYIDRVELDGKWLEADSNTYALKSNFKRLEIHYSTPYFGSNNNLNFETRLNDEEWRPVITSPIIFTSLSAGEHQLDIRKMDGSGGKKYTIETIKFNVPPAYWQTWWFILLCLGVFLGIIYTYTRLRVIYIQRKNALLEESISERTIELKETIHALKESKEIIERDAELQKRLTASIAHDVKTPLKYLLLTAGSLSKSSPEQLSNEQDTIKTVYQSLYRIYYFTDNLLAYIKSRFNDAEAGTDVDVNLKDLVQEKLDVFRDISKNQGTAMENNVSTDTYIHCNKNLLSVVIHNVIDNAVKFTFDGKIVVDSAKIGNEIKITIKDTGVGIHPEQMESIQSFFESEDLKWTPGYNKHNGLGLVIIKEIIKELNGRILMDSEKDEGTMVVLFLPVG